MVATQGKLKGYEQKLGFTIRLNDFDVATHEGTDAAADYISNITVSDNLGEYSFGEATLVPLEYIDGSVKYFVKTIVFDLLKMVFSVRFSLE